MINTPLILINVGPIELMIALAVVALSFIVSIYRRKKGEAAADSLMNIVMSGTVIWCIIAIIWLVIT